MKDADSRLNCPAQPRAGHVPAIPRRADTAALAGERDDEPCAALCAQRPGEAEAEQPAFEIVAEFLLDAARHGPRGKRGDSGDQRVKM